MIRNISDISLGSGKSDDKCVLTRPNTDYDRLMKAAAIHHLAMHEDESVQCSTGIDDDRSSIATTDSNRKIKDIYNNANDIWIIAHFMRQAGVGEENAMKCAQMIVVDHNVKTIKKMQLLSGKGMLLKLLVAAGLDQLDAELVCMELNQQQLHSAPASAFTSPAACVSGLTPSLTASAGRHTTPQIQPSMYTPPCVSQDTQINTPSYTEEIIPTTANSSNSSSVVLAGNSCTENIVKFGYIRAKQGVNGSINGRSSSQGSTSWYRDGDADGEVESDGTNMTRSSSINDATQISELALYFSSLGITRSFAETAASYLAKSQIGSAQMLSLLDKEDLQDLLGESGLQPFAVKIVIKALSNG